MADIPIGSAIIIAGKLITVVINLIDEHKTILFKNKDLKIECESIKILLEKMRHTELTPAHPIIQAIIDEVEEATVCIRTFLKKHEKYNQAKQRSVIIKRPIYDLKLFYYTWEHTQRLNTHTQRLEAFTSKLQGRLTLTDETLKPTSLPHESEINNPAAIQLWRDICGNKIHDKNASWPLFASRYQQLYPDRTWDSEIKTQIKSVALVEGDVLALFGFIHLINTCGFPLDYNKLPSILDCNVFLTKIERLTLAEKISNLSKDYFTDEVGNSVKVVHQWFKGKVKKKEIQERANECYRLIKMINDTKKKELYYTEEERLALEVEKARRLVTTLYLRFMVTFQIGHLSRGDFKNVDFPGRSRIRNIIKYYEPLDIANFCFIIVNDPSALNDEKIIKKATPKFYTFLREFLDEEKKDEQQQTNSQLMEIKEDDQKK